MQINTKVSIIIPVYNVAPYLERCLKSVSEQSYLNFEVILIDDGSTDDSGDICDILASRDSRFLVFHQKNSGVTMARWNGVQQSTGEWICFVDADDFLPRDAVNLLVAKIDDNVDAIVGFMRCNQFRKYRPLEGVNTGIEFCKDILKKKVCVGPFAKIFRKTIFDSSILDIPREFDNGEDYLMNFRLGQKCRKVLYIPDAVYCYEVHSGSANAKKSLVNKKGYLNLRNRLLIASIHPKHKKELLLPTLFDCCYTALWVLKEKCKNLVNIKIKKIER